MGGVVTPGSPALGTPGGENGGGVDGGGECAMCVFRRARWMGDVCECDALMGGGVGEGFDCVRRVLWELECEDGRDAGEGCEFGGVVNRFEGGCGGAVGGFGVLEVGWGDEKIDAGEGELEAGEEGCEIAAGGAVELARADASAGGVELDGAIVE